jgi:serine phosphatase RsbU (regulator of sigma subunit)
VGTVVTDATAERADRRAIELSARAGLAFEQAADEAAVAVAAQRVAVPALADTCRIERGDARPGPVHGARHLRLPLAVGGGALGELVLARGPARAPFDDDDLALAVDLAERTALRLRTARLQEERAHVARTLERALLPGDPPALPGAQLVMRHRSAQGEVGGDVLDAFPAGESTWFVLVGDVSGKGPEAAAVTALARHTLRAAVDVDPDPGAALALLNRRLLADGAAGGRFMSAACAAVRPDAQGLALDVAVAGHLPPLLRRADGTVVGVPAGGRLLGVGAELDLERAPVALGPGDVLLLHTDGVTETAPGARQLGEQGVRALLAGAGGGAQAAVDAVLAGALAAAGGELRDDAALLGLGVPGPAPGRGARVGAPS